MRIQMLLLIAGAGALGAIARYGLTYASERIWGMQFPVGTLLVNVIGCFLVGVLYHLSSGLSHDMRIVLGSGFLGALTTFSTFGRETFERLHEGRLGEAFLNVSSNLVLGLAAVALGFVVARQLSGNA